MRTAVTQAWLTAVYHRSKKMPDLQAVLARLDRKPAGRKAPVDFVQAFESMTAQLGGRDLRKKRETSDAR